MDAHEQAEISYRRNLIIGITTTALALAIISQALRLHARRISNARLWYDDYFMTAGLVFASIPCVCNYVGLRFGYGKHVSDNTPEGVQDYWKDLMVLQLAWSFTFPTIKLSILFFYRRIFPSRRFLLVTYGIGVYTLLVFASNTLVILLQCLPIRGFWQHNIEPHCIKQIDFYIASACLNLASDVFILLMPIPVLWNLKISTDRKLGLIFVFLLGSFACVVSLIRVIYLKQINPLDITWSNVGPGLLSTVEGAILVVSGNLPLMRPLFSKLPVKFRLFHSQQDEDRGMKDSLVLKYYGSNINTEISQGRHTANDHDSKLRVPSNAVGVRTDIHQVFHDGPSAV